MKKILAALFLVCMAVSFSATITWSRSVFVDTDFTVSSTDELIIQAGSRVRFGQNVRLIVYGQIKSMGTELDPVYLSPIGEYAWGGIEINSPSGSNEFNNTVIKGIDAEMGSGRGGVTFNNSTVTVSQCRFENNYSETGGAVKIISGNVTLSGSQFQMNGAPEGGAVYVLNDSATPALINILGCKFVQNDAWDKGGAIFIQDTETSASMDLNIIKCDMFNHFTGDGGAVYYDNRGQISLELAKSKMFNNTANWGSAIYMKFMETIPGNIPDQKFSNLLIFKNGGYYQSGVYIDMGLTQSPQYLNFTNATIAYNSIMPSKASKMNYKSGIYIKSNGNYPQIKNTILWQNTDYVGENNFFIEDDTNPLLTQIFRYCDIGGFLIGDTNISDDPIFVRAPQNTDIEEFDIDKYDFHLSVLSPCANAGDPLEPCSELNSTRIDIGAYGNTLESVRPYTNVDPMDVVSTLVVPSGEAIVLDFQGKAVKANWDELVLNSNSEIYIKAAYNADFSFKRLTANNKFDGGIVRIHTLTETSTTGQKITAPQELVIEESVNLANSDFNDIKLKFLKNTTLSASVTLNNTNFFTKDGTMPYALEIIDADQINIENSKFLNFSEGGIKIGDEGLPAKNSKASGRIANNTVSFEPTAPNKSKAGKQVGVQVINANIDIEDNTIDGGDEGVVMKAGSSGRISNNSVSFEPTASNKGSFVKKGIVVSDGSSSSDISNNIIVNDDWENTLDVVGIEIDNSDGVISYNQLRYGSYDSGPRTGINLISPQIGTAVYNNTIFGTYTGIGNSPSAEKIDITNNIFWSWDSTSVQAVNDTTNLRFFNNCFIKGLPAGITGENNFNLDPEFNSDYSGDFTLASTSPCINAGMVIDGVHSFASSKTVYYYGSAPDIGAEEFWQDSQPVNVSTTVSGTDFTFGWDAVDGFSYYKVYESDDPFGSFSLAYHGTSLSFTALVSAKKFYYVVATTDAPAKIYDSKPAVSEAKADDAPTPRERAKQFRIQKKQQNR